LDTLSRAEVPRKVSKCSTMRPSTNPSAAVRSWSSASGRAPAIQAAQRSTSLRGQRQLAADDHVAEIQPAAGREHAPDLAECLVLVGREVDDAVGDHEVDARVVHRQ
jgi:hypothetical protein